MWRSLAGTALVAAFVPAVADARDPWDPKTKIRQDDQRHAAAIVLTQADLGAGWSGGARKPASFPTAKQAKARFVRFMQPKLFSCLKYDLAKSIGGSGATILKPVRLDFPKVAERVGAFRVPVAVKAGSQTVTVDADFIYLGVGRSLIYVNIVAPSVQQGQLPDFEHRLARLLVRRAPA